MLTDACRLLLLLPLLALCLPSSGADKPEAPRAARSVHLRLPAPDAVWFYHEVTVLESQPGSYFSVCGFAHGYFGMQQLTARDEKVVIFSVWDPGAGDDPSAVPADHRVELISKGDGVRTGRFGGEGTGGQSFFTYPWKIGETCHFLLKAAPEGDKTSFSAYFYLPGPKRWQPIATFRTRTGGSLLKSLYCFIEDFRRDGKSATESRRARFGNGWVQTPQGDWVALTRARFTADDTPTMNVSAAPSGNGFLLETGGKTVNRTPLNGDLTRNPLPVPLP